MRIIQNPFDSAIPTYREPFAQDIRNETFLNSRQESQVFLKLSTELKY